MTEVSVTRGKKLAAAVRIYVQNFATTYGHLKI